MTHMAQFGWVSRLQKTAKTKCGKRVSAAQLAIDSPATCPHCRATVDNDRVTARSMVEYHKRVLGESAVTKELDALIVKPADYTTVYLL